MCTLEDDRTVQVCDIAIGSVRAELECKFAGSLTYVHRDGEPTRIVAGGGVSAAEFRSSAERAIARAQPADLG